MSDLLLQTKLFKPALRPAQIPRPHLIARLNGGLDKGTPGFVARLALVSAPAGFGKTTLVTAWLAQLDTHQPPFANGHVAWLSLDENDNDPGRFLNYLMAALQTAVPAIGEAARRFLQSPQPIAIESILTLLLNDIIHHAPPLILVLDDYHVITNTAVHQALWFLLDHLPPNFHLLLITRSDPPLPLSRLRVRQQLVEVRTDDLRFTLNEVSLFFNQVMGLTLLPEEIAALEQRTEGWIAGLQLAGLSLKNRPDQAQLIASFTGSHRFVIDYLTEEVLSQQTATVSQFLLFTSILERVCGPLAEALTQSPSGQAMLETLEQSNLFLIPLDDERHWYRYHHLFAEVLQQRLQQSQSAHLPELHHRASIWLEQNGWLHEAINHALVGGDYERAARLIEEIHGVKWRTGEIKTLQSWLAALPAEVWQTHPRLWLVQAWAAMTVGDFVAGDEKLQGAEKALALLDEATARRLRPEVLAFRASYASLTQDPQAVELAQQALQVLPEAYWMRGMLVIFLGGAYYAMGDLEAASHVLRQVPGFDSPLATVDEQPHQIHLLAFSGLVQLAKGKLNTAVSLANQALALAEPGGQPIPYVGTLLAYMSASLILYERNELKLVEAYLQRCLMQAITFGSFEVQVFALSGLVRISLATEDMAAAENYTGQINTLLQSHHFTNSIMAYINYHHFQLLLKQNNIIAAAAWVESETADQPGPLNAYAFHHLALPQLLMRRGDFAQALDKLTTLIEEAARTGHGSLLLKALVLKAEALTKQGQKSEALATLGQAIAQAGPEGFIRPFLDGGEWLRLLLADYRAHLRERPTADDVSRPLLATTEKLLAAFPIGTTGIPTARQVDPYIEPLSERELEVLRLVAAGASNREIASTLVLAMPTVKKHMSNIMSKLHANSRTQAVAEARTLGLL